jgi:hypothetical protein
MSNNRNTLWFRWTAANAFSELIGLGVTFAAIGLVISKFDTLHITGILISFIFTVLSGAIEATIVSIAQWWAMHPWFPTIERFAWWRATLVGALIGYVLGYLPSTLMSMNQEATQTAQAEPPEWITLLLAAMLGAVAGAILSFAQWLILRRKVKGAGVWIPANMLAWAFGMPIIFLGMDLAFKMTEIWQSVLVIGGAILVAGIFVGAIHGRFMVVLAGDKYLRIP